VQLYAIGSAGTRGRHFHPLFQFQLMGIGGAFLTGDAFNLFVFFEVLLIASYGLMIHGGADGTARGRPVCRLQPDRLDPVPVRAGLIYGVTGTLNMADIAVKVAALPEGEAGLIRVAADPDADRSLPSRARWCRCSSGCPAPMPMRRGRSPRCSPS
jgi:multicomponent K+:H+ antiporter subunit D